MQDPLAMKLCALVHEHLAPKTPRRVRR